jgi:hypothetical protein
VGPKVFLDVLGKKQPLSAALNKTPRLSTLCSSPSYKKGGVPINAGSVEVQDGAHHVWVEWSAILMISAGQDSNMAVF